MLRYTFFTSSSKHKKSIKTAKNPGKFVDENAGATPWIILEPSSLTPCQPRTSWSGSQHANYPSSSQGTSYTT